VIDLCPVSDKEQLSEPIKDDQLVLCNIDFSSTI
jgi:hypothetical protein